MRHRTWNFDVDRYLNPFVPSPPWNHIPYPVAWFLGHRKTQQHDHGNLMVIFWAFIGIFASLLTIQAVTPRVPLFEAHNVPIIVGSFGAAAVLEFYAIESPLAQPRNAFISQTIAAITGVAIGKLFQLSSHFHDIRWIGGALSCACATALMGLTKTVHPPAGATALLAVIDPNLVAIGWLLIPVMLLGCTLMLAIALLVNNLERRFPMYWWTPVDLGSPKPPFLRRGFRRRKQLDEERGVGKDATHEDGDGEDETSAGDLSQPTSDSDAIDADTEADTKGKVDKGVQNFEPEIVIRRGQVIVPENMFLMPEEKQLLESMSWRL
ncbi:hypothetical protein HIM_00855 [Hirsutella minnesotensis 3608]|nr:hypothetical protein HIM_00855 [Hirsutella minnesotensis 3608]